MRAGPESARPAQRHHQPRAERAAFSSASLDLLSALPNGDHVTDVAQGLQQLAEQLPEHPYSRLGAEAVLEYATQTEALLAACGAVMQGDARRPHRRVTPLGTLRPAWLSPLEVPVEPLPSQGACLVGISGFADFQPHLAAAALGQHGVTAAAVEIELPLLDVLRDNPTEFRAANIARVWMMRICGRPCMQRCYRWRSSMTC